MTELQLGPTTAIHERWLDLLALLDPRPGERILDVGFGRSEPLRWIANRVGPTGQAVGAEVRHRPLRAVAEMRRAVCVHGAQSVKVYLRPKGI